MLSVPLIDIAGFDSGDAGVQARIAGAVDAAARSVGFMQIVGHGIDEASLQGLKDAIDGFFSLPLHEKQRWRPPSPDVNRGYSGAMSERLSYSLGVDSAADLFEACNFGSSRSQLGDAGLPAAHYPENLWPDTPPQFRAQVQAWFDAVAQLARRMTRIFAHALALPEDHFAPYTQQSIDTLRLNHYAAPPEGTVLAPGQMGMGAHTDYGILTILWADAVRPGLQILDAHGHWHDVLPAPGALLINLGDLLARWTNDRWRSTMHRVLPPVDAAGRVQRRRSAAFFHDGRWDAVIECLPGCSDAGQPPLYAPVTVGEHLQAKLRGSRGLALNADSQREAERLRAAAN